MIEGMVKEKLFEIEVVTMSKEIFEQLAPLECGGLTRVELIEKAEKESIALVVDKEGRGWLIGREAAGLWRWDTMEAAWLGKAIRKYPWVGDLPQVFLTGKKRSRGKRSGARREG